jgi:TolB-like protein
MVAGYIAASWLLVQVVETLLPVFGFSDAAVRYTVLALAIGFIPALIVSWVFEWTPEGIVRDDQSPANSPARAHVAKTWDRIILVVMALALGLFAFERFIITPQREAALVEAATEAGIEMGRTGSTDIIDESVAVLPFANMSANPENEYFSDGLTETLLHMLAQYDDLKVAARTSSFAFKDKNEDIREIGQALGVAHVLEGSVQRASDRVRVTAQLIRAVDGYHVWSQNYDRTLDDIFVIQDEIATDVAIALGSSLLAATASASVGVATTNIDAYDYFLQGLNKMLVGSNSAILGANRLFKLALEADPGFTEARLALVHNVMAQRGKRMLDHGEAMDEAERLVGEVLSEDAENLSARQYEAVFNFIRVTWDQMDMNSMDSMVEDMLPLFEEGTGSADARDYAASFLAGRGGELEALTLINQALFTDPLNFDLLSAQSNALSALGRYEEARVPLMTQLEIQPDNPMVYLGLAFLERNQGNYAEALPYMKQHVLLDKEAAAPAFFIARFFDAVGLYEEADRWHAIFDARNPQEAFQLGRDLYRSLDRNEAEKLRLVVAEGMDMLLKGEVGQDYFGPLARIYAVTAQEDGTSQQALDNILTYYPGITDLTTFKGNDWLIYRLQYYGVIPLLLDLNDDKGDAQILSDALAVSDRHGIKLEEFDGFYLEYEYLINGLDAGKAVFMDRVAGDENIFSIVWSLHVHTPWFDEFRTDPEVAEVIAAREARIAEVRQEVLMLIGQEEWLEDLL